MILVLVEYWLGESCPYIFIGLGSRWGLILQYGRPDQAMRFTVWVSALNPVSRKRRCSRLISWCYDEKDEDELVHNLGRPMSWSRVGGVFISAGLRDRRRVSARVYAGVYFELMDLEETDPGI